MLTGLFLHRGCRLYFLLADLIDPINEGACARSFFTAVSHVPDEVIIYVQPTHLGGEKNIVPYAERGVLVGSTATVTPMLRWVDRAQVIAAEQNLCCVEKVRLLSNDVCAIASQGILNI